MARTHLEWNAIEYHYSAKNADWYWAVGIIAVSIAVTSIIFGNILFAIFILIGAAVLAISSARKPELCAYSVSDRGVIVGKTLFPFTSLESFWVEDHAHLAELHNPAHIPKVILKSKRTFFPHIVLPIQNISPDEVRDTLLLFLPEEEHMEPLSLKLMERLGF